MLKINDNIPCSSAIAEFVWAFSGIARPVIISPKVEMIKIIVTVFFISFK